MSDRIALVTGSTGGIGSAVARQLAGTGATIVLACRDRARGDELADSIRTSTQNDNIHVLTADLSSRRHTEDLARAFKSGFPKLDILVNNAGAVFPSRQVSEDGIEMTLALNHLGYFHLTLALLDHLKAGSRSRIVNVASDVHRFVRLDFDDLQSVRRYNPVRAYAKSKLANVLFTRELAQRLQRTNVTVNCLHPGGVRTAIYPDQIRRVRIYLKLFGGRLQSPEVAARAIVHLVSSPELDGITGSYFREFRPILPSRFARKSANARALWAASEEFLRRCDVPHL